MSFSFPSYTKATANVVVLMDYLAKWPEELAAL